MKIRKHGIRYQADAGLLNGIRLRRIFDTRRDAELWLADRRKDKLNLSIGITRLSPGDTSEALAALELLAGRATLTQAARLWREHNPEDQKHFSDAVKEFADHLRIRDSRDSYRTGILQTLNAFGEEQGKMILHAYTPEVILYWLRSHHDWTKTTFANRRRELSVFFNWCVKQGYIVLNPVARIPSPKIEENRIQVLTPEQTKNLLSGLIGPDRAYFAIACFAGLRPEEILRLAWADVHLDEDYIEVGAAQSKERKRRLVPIHPNLRKWLSPIAGWPTHSICRRNKGELIARGKAAAGLEVWPRDVCRHSYASYRLAATQDMNETALELGHTTTAMLFRRYRAVVTREAAAEYWSILP